MDEDFAAEWESACWLGRRESFTTVILFRSNLPTSARVVGIALFEMQDARDAISRPGYAALVKATGIHRQTVYKALKRLIADGWLVRCEVGGSVGKPRARNGYQLTIPAKYTLSVVGPNVPVHSGGTKATPVHLSDGSNGTSPRAREGLDLGLELDLVLRETESDSPSTEFQKNSHLTFFDESSDYSAVTKNAKNEERQQIAHEMTVHYYEWVKSKTKAPPPESFIAICKILDYALKFYSRDQVSDGLRALRRHRPPKTITRQTLFFEIQGLAPPPRALPGETLDRIPYTPSPSEVFDRDYYRFPYGKPPDLDNTDHLSDEEALELSRQYSDECDRKRAEAREASEREGGP